MSTLSTYKTGVETSPISTNLPDTVPVTQGASDTTIATTPPSPKTSASTDSSFPPGAVAVQLTGDRRTMGLLDVSGVLLSPSPIPVVDNTLLTGSPFRSDYLDCI